jgi:hypothetical protein
MDFLGAVYYGKISIPLWRMFEAPPDDLIFVLFPGG